MTHVDVAILGAGGAGLTMLDAICAGPTGLRVAVVDPVRHTGADRTWCFWDTGSGPVDDVIHHAWRHLVVGGPDGTRHRVALGAFRYAMVRSADFYARVADRARRAEVSWIDAAGTVEDGPRHATVRAGSEVLTADWVFDSRPRPPTGRGVTALVQHFRGALIETDGELDADTATFMDFAVPQPERGLAFGYTLPVGPHRALVEYTAFTRHRYPLDDLLRGYLPAGRVLSTEDGAIPMTDAPFARRAGRRVFRLGTAGGATRPSTGYTFRAMLRQAEAIADLLAAGREPLPPRPWPRRHRLADAILLRGLDRGLVDGPEFFTDLLTRQPIGRVLRFLDGLSTPGEELALFAGTPVLRMGAATASYLRGRLSAPAPPPAAP